MISPHATAEIASTLESILTFENASLDSQSFSVAEDKMRGSGKGLTAGLRAQPLERVEDTGRQYDACWNFESSDKWLKITTPCKSKDLQGVRQPSPRTAYA